VTAFESWIDRVEVRTDVATAAPVRALAATLEGPVPISAEPGAPIPPLWLWLYFLPIAPMREVGTDGHPRRGGFLPPIDLPRRMWAGSRCRFLGEAHIGAALERRSTIRAIAAKEGKSGPMVFVTVEHETSADGAAVMSETQDIVYLPLPEQFSPPPAQPLPSCESPLDSWTPSFLILRQGGHDGQRQIQRRVQARRGASDDRTGLPGC
jgi:3-methylfumaryl-CoA hydratase